MSLENATNVAELVPTNPAGTDPVSDGDAHLRMIKTVMQNNAIKQMNGLHPAAAENHFWDGSVPNELTLKRGTPDAPGAELIKALEGVLSFPNQGQSLVSNGYVKLPGGLIIQWGYATGNGARSVVFPIPFPDSCFAVTANSIGTGTAAIQAVKVSLDSSASATLTNVFSNGSAVGAAGEPVFWIAIGF